MFEEWNMGEKSKFKKGDKVVRTLMGDDEIPLGSVWVVEKVISTGNLLLEGFRAEDGSEIHCIPDFFTLFEDVGEQGVKYDSDKQTYNPLVAQEGGGHYKNRGIQPIEYSEANNLGACQHSVVKYITRHQDKNGIEDLSKIIHFTLLEAYFKYGEEGSTELRNKVLKLLGVIE